MSASDVTGVSEMTVTIPSVSPPAQRTNPSALATGTTGVPPDGWSSQR